MKESNKRMMERERGGRSRVRERGACGDPPATMFNGREGCQASGREGRVPVWANACSPKDASVHLCGETGISLL